MALTMALLSARAAAAPKGVTSGTGGPLPVERAKTTSPSYMVWAGRMAMAMPSWAIWATLLACSLLRGGVGCDDGQGSVAQGRGLCGGRRSLQEIDAVQEAEAIGVSGAGDQASGLGVYDAAKRVDCDEGPDDVIANPAAGAAEAALDRTVGAEGLAYGSACACTHGALGWGGGVGGGAGLVAVLWAGADGRVADGQVE